MSVAPLPWKVTSLPSMVGSLAGTLMGLFATGAPLAAGLAAAEPDAAGLAEADAGVEAAGLAEALAAGEAAIEGLAAAGAAHERQDGRGRGHAAGDVQHATHHVAPRQEPILVVGYELVDRVVLHIAQLFHFSNISLSRVMNLLYAPGAAAGK